MKVKNISFLLLALCFAVLATLTPLTGLTNLAKGYYCDSMYSNTGGQAVDSKIEFTYDSYTSTSIFLDKGIPNYTATAVNSCAPVAGTIIVGYYDTTLPNLIANYEPGYEWDGDYYFNYDDTTIQALKDELFKLMGTNTQAPGTSVTQFKNGLTSYVKSHGYNVTYTSCGKANIDTVKTNLSQQKPIAVFLNSYEYYPMESSSFGAKKTLLNGRISPNGHVVVIFGYQEFQYTKSNKVFRTDKYLLVACGDGSLGYMPINSTSRIDNSFAVNIY